MFEEQMASSIPLGRIGMPKEAAQAVIWLCSDAAFYVAGHSMIVKCRRSLNSSRMVGLNRS